MPIQADFSTYLRHYTRMGNRPCDWDAAEASPSKWACRKPWLPTNKQAKILDFGCGLGHQLLSLWCAGYQNIEGVDIAPELAEIAKQSSRGRVMIRCQDGRELLQNMTASYDVILLYDVIEHIDRCQVQSLLELVHQALVSNGRVVIRTPNMASVLASWSRFLNITHLWGYTEFSLLQLLDTANFENHCFVPEDSGFDLSKWRPWVPWRHLGLRFIINKSVHRFLYWARAQEPAPKIYGMNLEVYSHKTK